MLTSILWVVGLYSHRYNLVSHNDSIIWNLRRTTCKILMGKHFLVGALCVSLQVSHNWLCLIYLLFMTLHITYGSLSGEPHWSQPSNPFKVWDLWLFYFLFLGLVSLPLSFSFSFWVLCLTHESWYTWLFWWSYSAIHLQLFSFPLIRSTFSLSLSLSHFLSECNVSGIRHLYNKAELY